jgi:hypothetical protein
VLPDVLLLIVFVPLFAAINRIRGSDIRIERHIRSATGVLLGGIMIGWSGDWIVSWPMHGTWVFGLAAAVGYVVGENWGWGKWIGSIIHPDADPQFAKRQGYDNGIHQVANTFINERKHYLGYCRLALMLRGIWWWSPVFVPFYLFGCFGNWETGAIKLAVGVIALGIGFPLSVEASRRWNLRRRAYNGNLVWAEAEVFYGAMHGGTLAWLLVL